MDVSLEVRPLLVALVVVHPMSHARPCHRCSSHLSKQRWWREAVGRWGSETDNRKGRLKVAGPPGMNLCRSCTE